VVGTGWRIPLVRYTIGHLLVTTVTDGAEKYATEAQEPGQAKNLKLRLKGTRRLTDEAEESRRVYG
jgi:hypothetical protein